MTQAMGKPLMDSGSWFPKFETWFEFANYYLNVHMVTEGKRKKFTDFQVSIAPLAGVIVVNEAVGKVQQPLVRIYKVEGVIVADYFHEETFNETDLVRLANVFKASIA